MFNSIFDELQIKAVKGRGVFRTQANIYDKGFEEAPENYKIFKTKLRRSDCDCYNA